MTKSEIISYLKIDGLPQADQEALIARLESVLQRQTVLKIAKLFPDVDFSKPMSDKQFEELVKKKFPNIKAMLRDISKEFLADFIRKTA